MAFAQSFSLRWLVRGVINLRGDQCDSFCYLVLTVSCLSLICGTVLV